MEDSRSKDFPELVQHSAFEGSHRGSGRLAGLTREIVILAGRLILPAGVGAVPLTVIYAEVSCKYMRKAREVTGRK